MLVTYKNTPLQINKILDMSQAALVFLVSLKQRFQKFTNPSDPDYCPVYQLPHVLTPDTRYSQSDPAKCGEERNLEAGLCPF